MQDKSTANESVDKDCVLQMEASQEMISTEDNEELEKTKDEKGEDMETSETPTVEITPTTKTDTKKN